MSLFEFSNAQIVPTENNVRDSDQFWRRKVLSRIDLNQKINKCLVTNEPFYLYPANARFENTKGIIEALYQAFKSNKTAAYNPDTLENVITFETFFLKTLSKDKAILNNIQTDTLNSALTYQDDLEFDDSYDYEDAFEESDENLDNEEALTNEAKVKFDESFKKIEENGLTKEFLVPYNYIIEILEDQVFDKNKSDKTYKILDIRLIWIDPEGKIPDECIASFRFDDVDYILEQSQSRNKFNDSEDRTLLEILKLRYYSAFNINVSGLDVQTLKEAEKLRNSMIEFEHHLWEF